MTDLSLPGAWTWKEAADYLRVSVRTAHNLAALGEIETFRLGQRIVRVRPESCVRLRDRGLAVKSIRDPGPGESKAEGEGTARDE
jgi:excisionase family DNA binding protein